MANVERHEFFPTCIYRFKHDFKENELNNVVKHIEDNSLSEQNGQVLIVRPFLDDLGQTASGL